MTASSPSGTDNSASGYSSEYRTVVRVPDGRRLRCLERTSPARDGDRYETVAKVESILWGVVGTEEIELRPSFYEGASGRSCFAASLRRYSEAVVHDAVACRAQQVRVRDDVDDHVAVLRAQRALVRGPLDLAGDYDHEAADQAPRPTQVVRQVVEGPEDLLMAVEDDVPDVDLSHERASR